MLKPIYSFDEMEKVSSIWFTPSNETIYAYPVDSRNACPVLAGWQEPN